MLQHITGLTAAVLFIAFLVALGIPETLLLGGQSSNSNGLGVPQGCLGVPRTADRGWLLYDSNPEPLPFLPIILSEVHVIGAIAPGQDFAICRRVDRSTWTRRSAWLQVSLRRDPSDPLETAGSALGWITMPRREANLWVSEP